MTQNSISNKIFKSTNNFLFLFPLFLKSFLKSMLNPIHFKKRKIYNYVLHTSEDSSQRVGEKRVISFFFFFDIALNLSNYKSLKLPNSTLRIQKYVPWPGWRTRTASPAGSITSGSAECLGVR